MKVTLLNHSDSRGGSSVASMRLLEALRGRGVDARMLVMHERDNLPWVSVLGPGWRRNAAFLAEHLQIFLHNGLSRKRLFQASIATCGMSVHSHPWVREADAVVLGWVNQGMLSLSEIARIEAPAVWTMHDMWNLTGLCHHAGTCQRYGQSCGHCPLLGWMASDHDLSSHAWRRKQRLYARKPIRFVSVSNWLTDKCRHSSLMQGQRVDTVPNPFPVGDFRTDPRATRRQCGLPEGKRLVVMGAARLDDPVKGLDIAINALNRLCGTDAAAVLFGGLRDPRALDGLRLPHVHLGPVADPERLRDIYAHAEVVLSSSHYESLGLTLIEGMASGCVPVTFGQGGQTDIVDHLRTGYIARHPDAADLAEGIRFALSGAVDPSTLPAEVERRFGAEAVADRYLHIIEEAIGDGGH